MRSSASRTRSAGSRGPRNAGLASNAHSMSCGPAPKTSAQRNASSNRSRRCVWPGRASRRAQARRARGGYRRRSAAAARREAVGHGQPGAEGASLGDAAHTRGRAMGASLLFLAKREGEVVPALATTKASSPRRHNGGVLAVLAPLRPLACSDGHVRTIPRVVHPGGVATVLELMSEIVEYNEVDCRVMMEAVRYLRAAH